MATISPPSVGDWLGTSLLAIVLSVIAGTADVIYFLGLGGLFTAHITGNLAILAAHFVSGAGAPLAQLLSVPVFMLVVGSMRPLVRGLAAIGLPSLRSLLLLQFLLLATSLALCISAGPHIDPNAANAIVAGMLAVSAMAVQNAVVQISLKATPPTAVMTTNVVRFMLDVGQMVVGQDGNDVANARSRAQQTWPAIAGFALGAGAGAAGEATVGLWSLVLPTGLALLAFGLGLAE